MPINNWTDEKMYFFLKNLGLSSREIDVAKALLIMRTDDEVAKKLNISKNTVHSHRMNIYFKTNCHDRSEFILFLQSKGLFNSTGGDS